MNEAGYLETWIYHGSGWLGKNFVLINILNLLGDKIDLSNATYESGVYYNNDGSKQYGIASAEAVTLDAVTLTPLQTFICEKCIFAQAAIIFWDADNNVISSINGNDLGINDTNEARRVIFTVPEGAAKVSISTFPITYHEVFAIYSYLGLPYGLVEQTTEAAKQSKAVYDTVTASYGADIDISKGTLHIGEYIGKTGYVEKYDTASYIEFSKEHLRPGYAYVMRAEMKWSLAIVFFNDQDKIIESYSSADFGSSAMYSVPFFVPEGTYRTALSFMNFKIEVLELHAIYTPQILKRLKELRPLDPLPEEKIPIVYPNALYLTQDAYDIKNSVPYTLYISQFIRDKTELFFSLTNSREYVVYSSVTQALSEAKMENDLLLEFDRSDSIIIKKREVKSNVGLGKKVRLLVIGDSVTEGYGADYRRDAGSPRCYWEYVQRQMMLDALKSGDYSGNYCFQTIGFYNSAAVEAKVGEKVENSYAYAEGRASWSLNYYLRNEARPNSTVLNPFYDAEKQWHDDELNEENIKFSLMKFLERFRNYSDDGTPLEETDAGIGTNVIFTGTSDKRNLSVCHDDEYVATPTHVLIQLGFNDNTSTLSNDMRLICKAIREEFPDIIIGVSYVTQSGSYFYEKGYAFDESSINIQVNCGLHRKMYDNVNAVKQICNENDNIFFIGNMFIQPPLDGAAVVEVTGADGAKYFLPSGINSYHPSNKAHAVWAQQIYSWLKWTL